MTCASCGRNKKGHGYIEPKAIEAPPMGAGDIQVLDNGFVRRFDKTKDWLDNRHKLILFFPETFTPVCETEMGSLNQWVESFDQLDCDIYGATSDPIHAVKDWFEQEEVLKDPKYKVFSSYILPTRFNIMNNGRVKRASVFVTKEGDVVVQEHFLKVGRSIDELHRMMYGYSTGSYCAQGWKSPEDGFLTNDNAQA